MSSQTTTLDGNIDLLVRAMRDVLVGAMEKTGSDIRADIKTDLHAMENRLNNKIDTVETHLNEKIDTVETHLNEKIDTVETHLNEKIDTVETRLNGKIDTVEGCLNGQIGTTNKNMQAQFAQQERSIAELSKNIADIDRKLDKVV